MISLEQQFTGRAAPLFQYYRDPKITDILINGTKGLFLDRLGVMESAENPFESASELLHFVERLVLPIGKRIDAAQPYLDGRLVDGGRFHVILPPIAIDGPYISIRKFGPTDSIVLNDFGSKPAIDWLIDSLDRRLNILVCGSTGSGKTTLVSRCLDLVSPRERIAVVEETSEIRSTHPHLVRMESRVATPDGLGEVSTRDLLRNALRMRPDRIVLGECRGPEAFDLVQALNTGHLGSLGTIHANGCRDALRRLEALLLTAGLDIGIRTAREWIASAIGAVVHLRREGGRRYVSEAILVTGLEGELYRHQPVYRDAPEIRKVASTPNLCEITRRR